MQNKRKKNKIIAITLFVVALCYMLIIAFRNNRIARQNGYENFAVMTESIKAEEERQKQEQIEKTIIFITDSTINKDSKLIKELEKLDYNVEVYSKQLANFNKTFDYNTFADLHKNDANTFILNGGVMTDYLIGSKLGAVGKLGEDSICFRIEEINRKLQDKKVIFVSCPQYEQMGYDLDEIVSELNEHMKRNPADGEEKYTYEDYITITMMAAKGCDFEYIDLYNITKDNPVSFKNEEISEYDTNLQNEMLKQIKNVLEK